MTKLLLRFFVKTYDPSDSAKVRAAVGRLSGVTGILCNLLLFSAKLLAGTIAGSVSILADAMNNLSDASSSIVTLVGFRLAEKPADADHPYGHARFEYLSGLAVSAMIVIIGFELAKTSVEKLFNPTPVSFSAPIIVVLAASILMKLWLFRFNAALSKEIDSSALLAAATDSRNDAISTAAVLFAAAVEAFSSWQIDGFMGLAVALFILYSGASLAKDTISPLLGEAASPELRQLIVDIVKGCPKVLGYHDLMVHDYGPGQKFASIHVEMDQREDPLLCHELIDNMERQCLQRHSVHLVIHYDPIVTGDAELEHIRSVVQDLLKQRDNRLSIHDFRMVSGQGHTNLIFDIALPADLAGQEKEIQQYLEQRLDERGEGIYYTVITFDPIAFNEA